MVRQAGFEPALRASPNVWQARVLTKLDYCRTDEITGHGKLKFCRSAFG